LEEVATGCRDGRAMIACWVSRMVRGEFERLEHGDQLAGERPGADDAEEALESIGDPGDHGEEVDE
jgi:hypothetical protein